MTWSGSALALAVALGTLLPADVRAADDPPPFDRPGLAFNTGVFGWGQGSWEQGLPMVSWQRDATGTTRDLMLDSRWRVGMGHGLELQWARTLYAWQRACAVAGACSRTRGGGDGVLALKWALPAAADASTHWAVLATHKLAAGSGPAANPGRADQLALSVSHDLASNRSVGGSLACDAKQEGRGCFASVNLGAALRDDLAGYIEAGVGAGVDHARVAGTGLAWRMAPRWQLDGWMLRALDSRTPDWQYGLGVSVALGAR